MMVESQVNCIRTDKAAISALLYLDGELHLSCLSGFQGQSNAPPLVYFSPSCHHYDALANNEDLYVF